MGTQWLSDDEQRAWRAYAELTMRIDAVLERQLQQDSGMSMSEYAVLVALSEAEGRRLRAKDIADALGWERSRVSHQIRRMESRGFVVRSSCQEDGRGTFVTLSDQGIAAIQQAAPGHVEAVRRHLIDHLDHDDRAALVRMSGRVLAAMAPATC